jgi:hypothetical protein
LPAKDREQPRLNIPTDENTYTTLKIKAFQDRLPYYKLANFFIGLGLWLHDRLGFIESQKFVAENYPLLFLEAVRRRPRPERVSERFSFSTRSSPEVEAFLHRKRRCLKNENNQNA